MSYPMKHISIRVPWHDTGWDGRVCAAPRLNGACLKLKLKRIAEDRDDDAEESVAGQSIKDLPQSGSTILPIDTLGRPFTNASQRPPFA